ncbi:signal peptidase I [Kordiimonas aquimaris]|uniref:signal peptidase I n=1 Tax=Kordiimonas aquimaris TaxID=707591 RepID=UPI0021CF7050|nr:signal peptidase I [Kordiimonas aquimaris]
MTADNTSSVQQSSDSSKTNKVEKPASDMTTILKDIGVIAFFYLIFSTFGWASFHIPSGSMEPTLEVGDRIFVSKFSYGYNRFSVPFDPAFIPESRLIGDAPQRGDVAVFTLPKRGYEDFIKRVIGLPGDRIQMRAGRLYINGDMVERTLVREVNYTTYQGEQRRVKEYDETLPGGVVHRIYESSDRGRWDNAGPYVIPPGHYFMMGDNRDGSSDSRNLGDIGYVPEAYFVGQAQVTTFSLYDCDQGKDVYCLFNTVPLGRFFNGIE